MVHNKKYNGNRIIPNNKLCTVIPHDLNTKVCTKVICTLQDNNIAQPEAQIIPKLDPTIVDGCASRFATPGPHLQSPRFISWIDIDVIFFLPKGSHIVVLCRYILDEHKKKFRLNHQKSANQNNKKFKILISNLGSYHPINIYVQVMSLDCYLNTETHNWVMWV